MTRAQSPPAANLDFRDIGAGAAARGRRWVATFPGDIVSVHDIDIPPVIRGAERLKAARIMLADRVAQDPDDLVFLPLPDRPRDALWGRIAVMDRGAIDAIRRRCPQGALALLPDFFALPFADRCAVLAPTEAPGLCRLRIGPTFGCTAEAPILIDVLEALIADDALDTAFVSPDMPPDLAAQIGALELARIDPGALTAPDEKLIRAQDMGARADARADALGPWLKRNWPPVAALYVALALAALGLFLRAQDLEAEAQSVRDRATQLARDTVLPTGPILDLRQQVERALQAAKRAGSEDQNATFTTGVARMSARLAADAGTVSRIAWGAAEGYVIELTVGSFADLRSLADDLGAEGFNATVTASRVLGSGSVGATLRLTLSEGRE